MIKSHKLPSYVATILLLGPFLLTLGACAGQRITTAASMRIEVEVYKGPLSKTIDSQRGELVGLIGAASESLTTCNDSLMLIAASKGFVSSSDSTKKSVPCLGIDPHYRSEKLNSGPPTGHPEIDTRVVKAVGGASIHPNNPQVVWCKKESVEKSIKKCGKSIKKKCDVREIGECTILAGIHSDVRMLLKRIDHLMVKINARKKGPLTSEIVEQASQLAIHMKAKAMHWAQAHLSVAPRTREVRIAMANFSNLVSEYSNQIASRVDALRIQSSEGIDRKRLPLSTFLQSAKATDFLNLYTWNRAVAPAIWPEIMRHPIHAFSSDETADRVRVIERLFADHHWAKVNTVYASGQGDVWMALIKDDIGNWSLKSFDADPSELMEAYKDLARAGLGTAAKLIKGATKEGLVTAALDTASRLASSHIVTGGPKAVGIDISALRQRTKQQLETLERDAKKEQNEIDERIKAAKEKIARHEREVEKRQAKAEKPLEINASEEPKKLAEEALTKAIESEMKAEKLKEDYDMAKDAIEDAKKAKKFALEAENKLDENQDATQEANQARVWADLAAAKAKLAEWEAKNYVAKQDKEEHPKKIVRQARQILKDYAAVIDALQEVAVSPKAVGANASK